MTESERQMRLRELGIVPADESERQERLRELGIVPADEPYPGETGWTLWVLVDSSNVAEIRWHQEHDNLQVRYLAKGFQRQRTYEYYGVTYKVWKDMLDAPSKGKFVWDVLRGRGGIRHNYDYREIA